MRTPLCLTLLLCLTIAATTEAQTTDGKGALLTSAQIAKLRTAGKVVLPTYVPPHFRFTSLNAERGEYDISYTGPNGASLMVQMASEGIGDVILDAKDENAKVVLSTKSVTSPIFGRHSMDVLTTKKEHQFGVDWIDLGKNAKPKFLSISGIQMMPEEGAKVWRGLRYLK